LDKLFQRKNFMSLDPCTNFGKVAVSIGYDDVATSIALSASEGAKLPDPAVSGAFNLVWWNATDYTDPSDDPNVEIVRCTARSTDTLTVTRAQEGTAGSTKNTGGKSYKMNLAITKKMITDISNIKIEGGITKAILRSVVIRITPGATPNTNINIVAQSEEYGTWNAPTITDATNLGKDATVGSWYLSVDGIYFNLSVTQPIIACLGATIRVAKWNTAEGVPYYIMNYATGGVLRFYIRKVGVESTSNGADWTTILDANDDIWVQFLFITSS